jgi:hypothetical protein
VGVRLFEVIQQMPWPKVLAHLKANAPLEYDHDRLEPVYLQLQAMGEPGGTSAMRLVFRPPDSAWPEVLGRNGTRNRELPDVRATLAPEFLDAEVNYSLALSRWSDWLAMPLELDTGLSLPGAVAACLWEMTTHGLSKAAIEAVRDDLDRRLAAFEAESPEERTAAAQRSTQFIRDWRAKIAGTDHTTGRTNEETEVG